MGWPSSVRRRGVPAAMSRARHGRRRWCHPRSTWTASRYRAPRRRAPRTSESQWTPRSTQLEATAITTVTPPSALMVFTTPSSHGPRRSMRAGADGLVDASDCRAAVDGGEDGERKERSGDERRGPPSHQHAGGREGRMVVERAAAGPRHRGGGGDDVGRASIGWAHVVCRSAGRRPVARGERHGLVETAIADGPAGGGIVVDGERELEPPGREHILGEEAAAQQHSAAVLACDLAPGAVAEDGEASVVVHRTRELPVGQEAVQHSGSPGAVIEPEAGRFIGGRRACAPARRRRPSRRRATPRPQRRRRR